MGTHTPFIPKRWQTISTALSAISGVFFSFILIPPSVTTPLQARLDVQPTANIRTSTISSNFSTCTASINVAWDSLYTAHVRVIATQNNSHSAMLLSTNVQGNKTVSQLMPGSTYELSVIDTEMSTTLATTTIQTPEITCASNYENMR